MILTKNTAHIICGVDANLAYRKARELTSRIPGKASCVAYEALSFETMALSRVMAQDPTCVIVSDCPFTQYAVNFMLALATPTRLPCDIPGKPFAMKPAPYFVFLVTCKVPVRVQHPKIIVENLTC